MSESIAAQRERGRKELDHKKAIKKGNSPPLPPSTISKQVAMKPQLLISAILLLPAISGLARTCVSAMNSYRGLGL
jgi:hypothetical protein